MELGEAVAAGEFIDDPHSDDTCPWHHTKAAGATKKMAENDGGKLGSNLTKEKELAPSADSVSITYEREGNPITHGKKGKVVQPYKRIKSTAVNPTEEYLLQYGAHHLIPGNESLKGSAIVSFMGDDTTIESYKEGQPSYVDGSVDYDVNDAANGVWLPSPYALSNTFEWPAIEAIKVIKKRLGAVIAGETEDFKEAYVAEAIHVSGDRQFHTRHQDYSNKVREILGVVAAKMKLVACPVNGSKNGKFDPPMGLVERLNVLSENMREFLIGPVWRSPLFTDAMTKAYAEENHVGPKTKKGKVEKVM